MKTGLKQRMTAFLLTAALMLTFIPTILPVQSKAIIEEYLVEKLLAMSETGLSKIIAGVDHACGDDKVSSFVNTWFFENAGTAQTVDRIEELCEEILDRLDELEEEIQEDTSKIQTMIAQGAAADAFNDLDSAWRDQVDGQIPNDIAEAVDKYQAYFQAARQYGTVPTEANRQAKDAAREELRDAFVKVYQAQTGSYTASDLDNAMKTTSADLRFRTCMGNLIHQLNPDGYKSVADRAAMAAYQYYLFSADQYAFINSYMQKQLLTIGWVLLAYNELMAMQNEYIEENYSGTEEYETLMANYGIAEQDLAGVNTSLLEEAAALADRALTFSDVDKVQLRLNQLMKPEDSLIVNLRNNSYHSTFPYVDVVDEPYLDQDIKDYMYENFYYVKDPDNPASRTSQTGDFELVGVTSGAGTAFYYILQQPIQLQYLENKFDISSGALLAPDVHSPSCDWYNLRDWKFDFTSDNTAAAVKSMFAQTTVLALYGNTVRDALGEAHSPYTGDKTMYVFTPEYSLNKAAGTSYARMTFLEADEEVAGASIPSDTLSADEMQSDGGKKQDDVAIYIVERTDSDRTVNAVAQGDCSLELGVPQGTDGRAAGYHPGITEPFGKNISIKCSANGDETLSHLYVRRYLNSDKTKYTLEVIADSQVFEMLTPEDGCYYLSFPMPACDADIVLTTASADIDDGGVPATDFQQAKERLTALEKDTAVRTADVIAGSVSADGKTVAPLTELLAEDSVRTRAALEQLVDESNTILNEKYTYDNLLNNSGSRVKEANLKLDETDGAWRNRVTVFTDPFSGALEKFQDYVSCLAAGNDASGAEAAYTAELNKLAKATGDFQTDPSLMRSVEQALGRLIYFFTLTDETQTEPLGTYDPYNDNLNAREASVAVQAARAAYELYPFTNDQIDMIDTYLDAEINQVAWLLLMYQDMVSRQDPDFAGNEGYPAHVSRLAQLFLAGIEIAVDSDATFWADFDNGMAVTLRLSAYPTRADVYNGNALLEYSFQDEGYRAVMGPYDWDEMKTRGYEMHYNNGGTSSVTSRAEEIAQYNGFYILPVLAGHSVTGGTAGADLLLFQAMSSTHPLKTLEYKNDVEIGYDYHVPSTDFFNLMAEGYAEGGSVAEPTLNELAATQAFVNSEQSLEELLSPFVTTGEPLYLLIEPDTSAGNEKVEWDTSGTEYVKIPMVDATQKTMDYAYISAEKFQAGKDMEDNQYAFLRKADHKSLTVTGIVTNPGSNGASAMDVALDNAGYDPMSTTIWKDSLTLEPGSCVHLRIKPGDGETVTSLGVQRYTKENASTTVTYTQVIADEDDFRYLEKDAGGWYHVKVTVPYSWVGVTFVAQTSYSGGESGGGSHGGGSHGGGGGAAAAAEANAVTLPNAAGRLANGVVKASTANAKEGETVILTVIPDEGYQVKELTVTDADGNQIPVEKSRDWVYSFIMPATAVSIDPVLTKIEDVESGGDVSDRFRDVSRDAWYHDAVQWAVDCGLMNGVGETVFDPDGTATRAMVVTMLWRLAGEPEAKGPAPFTDVKDGAWYADAVAWAAESGAVNGTSETAFSPNEPVTREQLAAILYRYAQAQGKGFTGDWAFPLDYSDADRVSDYAYEALCWMTMNGVITGMGDGTLAPRDNATRAQIAAMFMRFTEKTA